MGFLKNLGKGKGGTSKAPPTAVEERSEKLESQIAGLEDTLEKSRSATSLLEDQLALTRGNLEDETKHRKELERRLEEAQDQLKSLQTQKLVNNGRKEAAETIAQRDREIESLKAENSRLNSECGRLVDAEEILKNELGQCKSQLEDQTNMNAKLQGDIISLKASKVEPSAFESPRKTQSRKDAHKDLEVLKQRLQEEEQSREASEQKLKTMSEYVVKLEAFKQSADEDRKRSAERFNEVEQERSRLNLELVSAREQHESEVQVERQRSTSLADNLKMKEVHTKNLEAEASRHSAEVELLKRTIESLKKEKNKLEEARSEAQNKAQKEVNEIKKKLEASEKKKKDAEREATTVKDEAIIRLKGQVEEQTTALLLSKAELQKSNKKYEAELEVLKKSLHEEKLQVEALKEEVKALSPPQKVLSTKSAPPKNNLAIEVGPQEFSLDDTKPEADSEAKSSERAPASSGGTCGFTAITLILLAFVYLFLLSACVMMVDSSHDMAVENLVGSHNLENIIHARDWVHANVPTSLNDMRLPTMDDLPSIHIPELPKELPAEWPEFSLPEGVTSGYKNVVQRLSELHPTGEYGGMWQSLVDSVNDIIQNFMALFKESTEVAPVVPEKSGWW